MSDTIRNYAAVLFDFDGTLIDSYPAIAASVNHVRARHGLGALPVAEVKRHVGHGAEYLLTHTVPAGILLENLEDYKAHHPSVVNALTTLLPGAAELLRLLDRAGKKIALCSNKPRKFSVAILEHFELYPYFDAVLGPENVPLPKPAPDMVRVALERLDVDCEKALYVGDMTVDIQTARAAGTHVWVVPTGSEERAALECAEPDRLLDDLRELVAEASRI